MIQVARTPAHLFVVLEVRFRARQLGFVLISLRLAWHAGCRMDSYHEDPFGSWNKAVLKASKPKASISLSCALHFSSAIHGGQQEIGLGSPAGILGLWKRRAHKASKQGGVMMWETGQRKTMVST